MSREIKFRAWNTKTKCMTAPIDWYDVRVAPLDSIYWEVLRCVPKKDRNGNCLFDGAIIKEILNDYIGVVKIGQDTGNFYVDWKTASPAYTEWSWDDMIDNGMERIEVIGHILENPELLEDTA